MKKSVILLLILLTTMGWLRAQNPKAEYFFDTDPGVGLGIPLSVVQTADVYDYNGNISTAALCTGFHRIYFRFQDDLGRWGLTENCLLFVFSTTAPNPVPNQPVVTAIEYYFDTDPGVGLGNPLVVATSGDEVVVTTNISTNNLETGFHRIYVRARDQNGKWSITENQLLYAYNTTTPNPVPNQSAIAAMEYFIDNDPGVGQGITLPNFSPGDSVTVITDIPTATLSGGKHAICIRAKDLNGKWSIYETKIITICATIPVAGFSADTVCYGSPSPFTDMSANKDPGATYAWDFNNDGTIESTQAGNVSYTFPKAGTFTSRLLLTNPDGCNNEFIKEVRVDTIPNPAGTITGPVIVSKGQNSVVYSVPTISDATSYVWDLPMGAIGTSSSNLITVNFGLSAVSGNIIVRGSNNCGVGNSSVIEITVLNLHEELDISNIIITTDNDTCFNATQTITLAGGGTTVDFNDGSTVSLIAGQSIRFLPGFHAHNGCSMNAWITTNSTFCNGASGSPVVLPAEKSLYDQTVKFFNEDEAIEKTVKVYPNPNDGNFTIEFSNMSIGAEIIIYNTLGKKVFRSIVNNPLQKQVDLGGIEKGLYLVKIIDGREQFVNKMLVN